VRDGAGFSGSGARGCGPERLGGRRESGGTRAMRPVRRRFRSGTPVRWPRRPRRISAGVACPTCDVTRP